VNQQVKAVTPNCKTCGGPHSFNDCPATVGQTQNVYAAGAYQGNTITNPKEELKGITTRSETAYQGPTIPTTFSSLPLVVERQTEATKDTVRHTNNGSTKDVQPSVVQTESLILNSEPIVAPIIDLVASPVSASKPNQRPLIPVAEYVYVKVGKFHFPVDFIVVDFDADPRVTQILERSFLKTGRALIDVFEGELTLRVGKGAITFNLDQTSRYSANYNDMRQTELTSLIWLVRSIRKNFSVSPMKLSAKVRKELKICEAKTDKSSIDEPPEVELKDLPSHLEYVFLEGDDKLPVIIAKDLSVKEKTALITVLKLHKPAITCKLSDIKGIDLKFCTHKILMEDDFEPAVQHHRRVNPKIHDVIKNEVLKVLDAGLIYPISDSPWEKSHFMVKEGIVLGHKISKNGIEVDKAKVNVIAKFPHSTTIKGIRSFLSHAGFYRRFIKYFSKIARPMTRLFEKDTLFFFLKECVEAFQPLKRKLTEAPILIAPTGNCPLSSCAMQATLLSVQS
nr:hypothetical protein [Tanacetum cinerariifolium]